MEDVIIRNFFEFKDAKTCEQQSEEFEKEFLPYKYAVKTKYKYQDIIYGQFVNRMVVILTGNK